MYGAVTRLTEQYLLLEFERVEEAVARSTIAIRWLDAAGRAQLRIGEDLLAVAEREPAIVQELRRRRGSESTAVRAVWRRSSLPRRRPRWRQHDSRQLT